MKQVSLFLIRFYQTVSRAFPSRCKYVPSCSEYARQAFLRYGFFKACGCTAWRILRCHPLARGGFDPLP